jgi:hypothetical protein
MAMKASVHVLASMLRCGRASTHLVDLSMAVNRYRWLSEEAGEGTTRSTCARENLRAKWRGVELLACLWTFPRSHCCWQSRHMAATLCIQNSVPDPDLRIHMFLGLPDPDPLVRGMDPDPDPHVFGPPGSGFFYHPSIIKHK